MDSLCSLFLGLLFLFSSAGHVSGQLPTGKGEQTKPRDSFMWQKEKLRLRIPRCYRAAFKFLTGVGKVQVSFVWTGACSVVHRIFFRSWISHMHLLYMEVDTAFFPLLECALAWRRRAVRHLFECSLFSVGGLEITWSEQHWVTGWIIMTRLFVFKSGQSCCFDSVLNYWHQRSSESRVSSQMSEPVQSRDKGRKI